MDHREVDAAVFVKAGHDIPRDLSYSLLPVPYCGGTPDRYGKFPGKDIVRLHRNLGVNKGECAQKKNALYIHDLSFRRFKGSIFLR